MQQPLQRKKAKQQQQATTKIALNVKLFAHTLRNTQLHQRQSAEHEACKHSHADTHTQLAAREEEKSGQGLSALWLPLLLLRRRVYNLCFAGCIIACCACVCAPLYLCVSAFYSFLNTQANVAAVVSFWLPPASLIPFIRRSLARSFVVGEWEACKKIPCLQAYLQTYIYMLVTLAETKVN